MSLKNLDCSLQAVTKDTLAAWCQTLLEHRDTFKAGLCASWYQEKI